MFHLPASDGIGRGHQTSIAANETSNFAEVSDPCRASVDHIKLLTRAQYPRQLMVRREFVLKLLSDDAFGEAERKAASYLRTESEREDKAVQRLRRGWKIRLVADFTVSLIHCPASPSGC